MDLPPPPTPPQPSTILLLPLLFTITQLPTHHTYLLLPLHAHPWIPLPATDPCPASFFFPCSSLVTTFSLCRLRYTGYHLLPYLALPFLLYLWVCHGLFYLLDRKDFTFVTLQGRLHTQFLLPHCCTLPLVPTYRCSVRLFPAYLVEQHYTPLTPATTTHTYSSFTHTFAYMPVSPHTHPYTLQPFYLLHTPHYLFPTPLPLLPFVSFCLLITGLVGLPQFILPPPHAYTHTLFLLSFIYSTLYYYYHLPSFILVSDRQLRTDWFCGLLPLLPLPHTHLPPTVLLLPSSHFPRLPLHSRSDYIPHTTCHHTCTPVRILHTFGCPFLPFCGYLPAVLCLHVYVTFFTHVLPLLPGQVLCVLCLVPQFTTHIHTHAAHTPHLHAVTCHHCLVTPTHMPTYPRTLPFTTYPTSASLPLPTFPALPAAPPPYHLPDTG